jgi:hypothetical protein
VPTGSLLLIYTRTVLFGTVSRVLTSTRQVTSDFLVHIANPYKSSTGHAAAVELSVHDSDDLMILYI